MNTLNFKIVNIKAIDSFLYAGNLFVIFADGRIAYISYDLLLHLVREAYPQYKQLLGLAFLHNDYVQTNAAKLLLDIDGVKSAIRKQWEKAVKDIDYCIDYNKISSSFHVVGQFSSMPLDVRIYAMRLFLGCRDGLYESVLLPTQNTKVDSTPLTKRLDTKVVAINAKFGAVAISADREGLFSAEVNDDMNCFTKVVEHPIVDKTSLRSEWMDIDLLSYENDKEFYYVHNSTEQLTKQSLNFSSIWKGGERRRISQMGTEVDDMYPFLEELNLKTDDIDYCFNSNSSTFVRLKSGMIYRTDFKHRSGGSDLRMTIPTSKGRTRSRKILSTAAIPNGCVLNYYDRVEMSRAGQAYILSEYPAQSVRSYPNAPRYRSIVSINTEEELMLHSTEDFLPMPQLMESTDRRVLSNNLFKRKNKQPSLYLTQEPLVGEDLPF